MADKQEQNTFAELKGMVTDYAKQQTVDPLKNLAMWAGYGLGGAIMFAIGGFLLALGALRLVQSMDWTDGFWSFGPYLIVFVLLMMLAGACFWAMTRTPEWMEDDPS